MNTCWNIYKKSLYNIQEGRAERGTDESGLTMTCQPFKISDGKKWAMGILISSIFLNL